MTLPTHRRWISASSSEPPPQEHSWLWALWAATCLLMGCVRPPEAIAHPSLDRLPGTESIRGQDELGFSLSPDGTCLFFEVEPNGAAPAFVFYDLAARRSSPIGWTPEARAALRGVPLVTWQRECWSSDSSAVHARAEDGALVAIRRPDGATWEVRGEVPRETFAASRREGEPRVRFELRSGALQVVDTFDSGRVLATHDVQSPTRSALVLLERTVCTSADGAWIAYATSETRGSFAASARLRVLPLTARESAHRELSHAVRGVPQWLPGSTALLFLQDGQDDERGIFLWKP